MTTRRAGTEMGGRKVYEARLRPGGQVWQASVAASMGICAVQCPGEKPCGGLLRARSARRGWPVLQASVGICAFQCPGEKACGGCCGREACGVAGQRCSQRGHLRIPVPW